MAASDNNAKLEAQILKQVEFYFSDSNLPRDRFLLGLTEKDEGWVPIATLASFKRMQQLTKDIAVVVAALRKSEKLLEVNEDGTKVKRTQPLEVDAAAQMARSIYAKGFPLSSTQQELEAFWADKGDIKAVRARRYRSGKERGFKGSVFVEFGSVEEAQKIAASTLETPKKEGEKNKLETLLMMMKQAYVDAKAIEIAGNRANKAEKQQAREAAAMEQEKQELEAKEHPKDCLVEFKELGAEASREDLKEKCEQAGGSVAYVDFSRGQTEGFVRLNEDSALKAAAVAAKLTEDKVEVCGKVAVYSALEGEEEKKYWLNLWARQAERKRKGNQNKRNFKRQRR